MNKYDKIVLFDGDDNRTKLFEDNKQLSKIPSNCEFYIFTNEEDPIRDKVFDNLFHIPQVRLRRSSIPAEQRILDFLQSNIDKYSFILIVCHLNLSYERIFNNIWKKYGKKKFFVISINHQSNITIKDILNQLHQHGKKESIQTLISFSSNDTLQEHEKNIHKSFLSNDLYLDSSVNISMHRKANDNNKLFITSELFCPICNDYLHSKKARNQHMEKEHPEDTPDYYE